MRSIAGGFELSPADRQTINTQKSITRAINERFIQVGAVFLKPASKLPLTEDWFKRLRGDVDLQSWIDDPEQAILNVGFNLQLGWMDVDIDTPDPAFARCIISAMRYLQVDTRFAFGRASMGTPTHILVQLPENQSGNFEMLSRFEPKAIVANGARHHVQMRSFPTNAAEKNVVKSAKQTVAPGSLYVPKSVIKSEYDMSVWWDETGVIAKGVQGIAQTTPRKAQYEHVVRAISFGVILYCVKSHWQEGSRHAMANRLTGWIARIVRDSSAVNAQENIAGDVFCPLDTDDVAEALIKFVCAECNDDEPHMRVRTYYDAAEKLSRNPDAKIPGWHSLAEAIGEEAVTAMRTVVMPGSDISVLTKMVERYVYDETDNRYIDRTRHSNYAHYIHAGDELERRHKSDTVFVAGKPREAFKIFESSTMRKRVGFRDLYPDLLPGTIYRLDTMGNAIPDEDDSPAVTVFNTWKGWAIQPTVDVDPGIMAKCKEYLDALLNLLTRNNPKQVEWVKKWLAWTIQNPGTKQQIAWVVMGGQGVGKSFFGNVFMRALLTERLWGSASPSILDNKFNIGPFKDKMFVFVDEAKFQSGSQAVEEIKKLIRNVDVSGMEKFEEARDYRIFARLMFASNLTNLNIGQRDVRDRALFYTRAVDQHFLSMTEMEFREHTLTLKPFFDEFVLMLKDRSVIEHYMRFFMDYETDRHSIESIKESSSSDPEIVEANTSWVRRVAKSIIESGWVADESGAFEMPFDTNMWRFRVQTEMKAMSINVQPQQVLNEFDGMLETCTTERGSHAMRFKLRWGSACAAYEDGTGLRLNPYRPFDDADHGPNEYDAKEARKLGRKGGRASISGKF